MICKYFSYILKRISRNVTVLQNARIKSLLSYCDKIGRDGYVNMRNISKIISAAWPIVILHVRRLQLIGSRQNTCYCYLYKRSQRLLNSFYERKVCIALSTNDTRIISTVGESQLNSLILICDQFCLFCLEILGSYRRELDNIFFSFDRRFVLGPWTNIFDLSNKRKDS